MTADQKVEALDKIEERAAAVRKTMTEVCRRAKVAYSTWYRARVQGKEPEVKTIGALEDALTAFENERAGV